MNAVQLYLRDAVGDDMVQLVGLIVGDLGTTGVDSFDHFADYLDALREIDRTPGNYLLVADRGGSPIAMAQLIVMRRLDRRGGRSAEIVSLRVAPDWRRKGVGGQLLDHAVARATDLGCDRVSVVASAEPGGAELLAQRGFKHRGASFALALDLDWTPTRSMTRRWAPDAAAADSAPWG